MICYGRVSSRRQQNEGDLERQVQRLEGAATKYGHHEVTFTDVASGLSDKRSGLKRALTACQQPDVAYLLTTHPERLARFGTGTIEHLLKGFGVTVIHIGEDSEKESAESELVKDMLAVFTSFAGRLYGQRSAKARRITKSVQDEVRNDAA